jgi:hypothetical protein
VFLYWLLQSIGNYITYFSCSTYCSCFHKSNTRGLCQWVSVGVSFVYLRPEISVTSFPLGSFLQLKPCSLLTCIDIRLSDRVRSFDCTIRSTYCKGCNGFPVIVKPTIRSVTITFVSSVPCIGYCKSIGNYITYFSCSTCSCFHKSNTRGLCQWGIRGVSFVTVVPEISVTLFFWIFRCS